MLYNTFLYKNLFSREYRHSLYVPTHTISTPLHMFLHTRYQHLFSLVIQHILCTVFIEEVLISCVYRQSLCRVFILIKRRCSIVCTRVWHSCPVALLFSFFLFLIERTYSTYRLHKSLALLLHCFALNPKP